MHAVTLSQLIAAFVNFERKKPLGAAALHRLNFWKDALGARVVVELTADDVDATLAALQARGRLRPVKGGARGEHKPVGAPLAGSTVNRYLSSLGELLKHARRLKIVPRNWPSPLAGLERAPEPVDPNRYLRAAQIEQLITAARVVDRDWGRMCALILLAFVTGLRVSSLMALRWCDVDLLERLVRVGETKNGDPINAPLTEQCVEELKRLPKGAARDLIFRRKSHPEKPHHWRNAWNKVTTEAGLAGRNFHQIRHGTGSFLAARNVNQAGIMAVMGHRTLAASRRYMHHNLADKREIVERAFGK